MRFKKGETKFYKKHDPEELAVLVNNFPRLKKRIEGFLRQYKYNPVKGKWNRRETPLVATPNPLRKSVDKRGK